MGRRKKKNQATCPRKYQIQTLKSCHRSMSWSSHHKPAAKSSPPHVLPLKQNICSKANFIMSIKSAAWRWYEPLSDPHRSYSKLIWIPFPNKEQKEERKMNSVQGKCPYGWVAYRNDLDQIRQLYQKTRSNLQLEAATANCVSGSTGKKLIILYFFNLIFTAPIVSTPTFSLSL